MEYQEPVHCGYYEIRRYYVDIDAWQELDSRFLSDDEVAQLRNAGYSVWSVPI